MSDEPRPLTPITYSPATTIVPTYGCFNRCGYCSFRQELDAPWRSLEQVRADLVAAQGLIEILILSGEVAPTDARRAAWLDHSVAIATLALQAGFLPHSNIGPLARAEMQRLKAVNVSLGLMLEQLRPDLVVHRQAPSKAPALRLAQLQQAGELQIPFTTGMLIGIGETRDDWAETLIAIASLHQRYGHIQEVIIQPFRPNQGLSLVSDADVVAAVTLARQILPTDMTLQVPPNLTDSCLLACLAAGARDLGGLVPHDHVNPRYRHPHDLAQRLEVAGYHLVPRLPVYPQYEHWLSPELQAHVQKAKAALEAQRWPNQSLLA